MNVQVKICGLKTKETIKTAIENGAHFIGFIFFEKSPRHLSVQDAQNLRDAITPPVKLVAVSVDASNEMLDEIVAAVKPDFLQLHGHESVFRVNEIKLRYRLPIIKAFSIKEQSDLDEIAPYASLVDYILLDAKAPKDSPIPGGNGMAFDWSLLKQFDDDNKIMLSGGLNAKNIDVALSTFHPKAIDISSGVESQAGIKDKILMQDFFAAVKKATNNG